MHRFRLLCIRAFALVLPLFSLTAPGFAATPQQVDAALERAKTYLYKEQINGLWEKRAAPPTEEEKARSPQTAEGGQWGGTTALVVYALLAAGESPADPRLAAAIKFLRTVDIKGSYALGMRAQLWPFLPESKDVRKDTSADIKRFLEATIPQGPAAGLFDYLLESKRTRRFDHSISQFGVLGMWACERAGSEVPTSFWQQVQSAWERDQLPDGSWCYGSEPEDTHPITASMTAAGIATLFITQDYTELTNGIKCTGNIVNPHIDAGLKWLDQNFEHVFTDKGIDAPYYALFGIERVGVASGRKYLGSVNWYERGADFLVENQTYRGSWHGVADTCFGVLFLARGRAPVIFNKLQYNAGGKEGNWNERPRDIANLTRWMQKNTERDLNWQIVNLTASPEELLDAPVLYISGNKALAFSPKEEQTLREYCEDGGLIMGNPDCQSSEFTASFRKLALHLFHDYEFRNLPARHAIFTNEQYPRSSWKSVPTVLSLSNGVRELMILTSNSDPARRWQTQENTRHLSDFELADDVVLYAIDKHNLLEKGRTFTVTIDPKITTDRVIRLARLQFAGNWNPEPGGWRRMAAILHNDCKIDLQISNIKLGARLLGDGKTGVKVAVLTGTSMVQLTAAQRQELKDFVQGDGTLIVDAAGGDSDFASSVETELQIILGSEAGKELKTALPATDGIFNLSGGVIKEFTYRPFARTVLGTNRSPLLCAVTVNNRRAVFYSRQDLSAGLVGQPTDGIVGYDPQTATKIMTNLVIIGGLGATAPVVPGTETPAFKAKRNS